MKNVLNKIKVLFLVYYGLLAILIKNEYIFFLAFGDCCLDTGLLMFYKCKSEVKELNSCMAKWFVNEDFIKECRIQYLDERRTYRLTGIKKHEEKKIGS